MCSCVEVGNVEHTSSISSYCHRRKVCPAPLRLPVLSACDWILCSERTKKKQKKLTKPAIFKNRSNINVSVHVCSVCSRVSLQFVSSALVCARALTLPLFLFFLFGVSISKSSSSWNPSPFSSASRTLCSAQSRGSVDTFLLKYTTLCVMSVQLPVFPARSPLPYTGCSFSPADCPPSAGPPGLWPLLGHHRASEPARLLTRRRWQEEEIKKKRRISHLRCAFTLTFYAQMAPSFPKAAP